MTDQEREEAQQIIIEVWKQFTEKNMKVAKIFISRKQYKLLQLYRNFLGELDNSSFEYLEQYQLFGADLYLNDSSDDEMIITSD